jgi:prepilin peptidase CpaA
MTQMMEPKHVAVLIIALVACVTDVRSRRIPNVLTFGAAAAGLAFHALAPAGEGITSAGLGMVLGVAAFFIPFALGGLGGGDVKLLGALGAWLGPATTVWVVLYTGVAGGVMAVVVSIARGYARQAAGNVYLLLSHWRVAGIRALPELTLDTSEGPRLAYAIPIFAGTAVALWLA